ncbi:MAG TPA: hypothetical protein CFH84_04115 [Sulfurimonas sp. UBA12504]|nr:MAG: hypothetical protein A2019_03380 [Sulfurimonas sp. GWF2_37_8]DAB30390.1 MAG TPA: hypothetical protein CFH84_04115 [Sulfurimonas sp. UBA12504]
MNTKTLFLLLALAFLFIMGIYVLVHPSYQKSLQAKYFFEMGNYKEALVLAKEAFSMDVYNRMASTIMAQTITALKYASYIEMGEKYMAAINIIATHENISDADTAKIRTMCEIMVAEYIKLAPSVITDENLVQEASEYHHKFEKLLEKVTR